MPPTDIVGPDLISVSISPTSPSIGDTITVTVVASDDSGINHIKANWKRPLDQQTANVGSNISIECSPEPVSTVGGTVTCTGSKVLTANSYYSGDYEFSIIYLQSTEPANATRWETEYNWEGYVMGHGRGGVVGGWHNECCHSFDIPSISVQ